MIEKAPRTGGHDPNVSAGSDHPLRAATLGAQQHEPRGSEGQPSGLVGLADFSLPGKTLKADLAPNWDSSGARGGALEERHRDKATGQRDNQAARGYSRVVRAR